MTAITKARPDDTTIEAVLIKGDLSQLTESQRLAHYQNVCASLKLNPLTQPFDYIRLNNKLVLYAKRDAAEQLRKLHGVSITELTTERFDEVYVVTVKAQDKTGRTDMSTGAVPLGKLGGEALANQLMKCECVPLDSEILTLDGWKVQAELRIGEMVLAYDTVKDETVWTPLVSTTVHPAMPVMRLRSTGGQFSIRCTSDHSWAVRRSPYIALSDNPRGPYASRGPAIALVKTSDLTTQRLVLAAPERETVGPLSATEAGILGWAVTDGTIKRVGNSVRIGICQSKEDNFEHIRDLVGAFGGDVKEFVSPARARTFPSSGRTYQTKEQHWWYLPSGLSRSLLHRAGFVDRSDLPRLATRLGTAARRAMLNAFMCAEADARGTFYNGDPHVMDTLQILCACEGIATGSLRSHLSIQRIRVKRTRHLSASFLNHTEDGIEPVWCPTTEYGTWVMRQNGRVMITGNTKAKRRVTLSICGLGMLDETEVETIRQPAPPLIVEAAPERPPAPEGFVYLERIDAKTTKGGRAYADVTLSTGEIVMAFGEMVKLLEQLAQDQVAVQIETEKTPKGYTHIIEARTAAGMMKAVESVEPPSKDIPFG